MISRAFSNRTSGGFSRFSCSSALVRAAAKKMTTNPMSTAATHGPATRSATPPFSPDAATIWGRRSFTRCQGCCERFDARQSGCSGKRRRRSIPWVRIEAAQNHALHRQIEIRHQRGRAGRRPFRVKPNQFIIRRLERAPSGEDVIEHQTERINIAARADFFSGELLRRHVCRGAVAHLRVLKLSARPASPKSVISTLPRPSIMMFEGFRSRCRTPRSCAAAIPAQSLRAISRALS